MMSPRQFLIRKVQMFCLEIVDRFHSYFTLKQRLIASILALAYEHAYDVLSLNLGRYNTTLRAVIMHAACSSYPYFSLNFSLTSSYRSHLKIYTLWVNIPSSTRKC